MHVSSCETIRLSISFDAVSRFGVMASTSSMKKIHGAAAYKDKQYINYTHCEAKVNLQCKPNLMISGIFNYHFKAV